MDPKEQKYLDQLLEKYLKGECSPEEEELVDRLYNTLSLSDSNPLKDDPEFAKRTRQHLKEALQHHTTVRTPPKRLFYWSAAASFIGLIAVSLFLIRRNHQPDAIASTSIHTDRNQRKQITLPDSSIVWLNQYSTLTWSYDPNGHERRVQLTGEARFKVTQDATKPFIVETGSTYTKVLGTEFDIEAYADEKEIKVSLLNGKVQFGESAAGNNPAKSLAMLLPGRMATYYKTDHRCQESPIGSDEVDSWTQGVIVFNQVPLQEAIHRLALRYNWQISWRDRRDSARLPGTAITGSFRHETPEEILTAIAYTNHFQFTIKNNKVTIY